MSVPFGLLGARVFRRKLPRTTERWYVTLGLRVFYTKNGKSFHPSVHSLDELESESNIKETVWSEN